MADERLHALSGDVLESGCRRGLPAAPAGRGPLGGRRRSPRRGRCYPRVRCECAREAAERQRGKRQARSRTTWEAGGKCRAGRRRTTRRRRPGPDEIETAVVVKAERPPTAARPPTRDARSKQERNGPTGRRGPDRPPSRSRSILGTHARRRRLRRAAPPTCAVPLLPSAPFVELRCGGGVARAAHNDAATAVARPLNAIDRRRPPPTPENGARNRRGHRHAARGAGCCHGCHHPAQDDEAGGSRRGIAHPAGRMATRELEPNVFGQIPQTRLGHGADGHPTSCSTRPAKPMLRSARGGVGRRTQSSRRRIARSPGWLPDRGPNRWGVPGRAEPDIVHTCSYDVMVTLWTVHDGYPRPELGRNVVCSPVPERRPSGTHQRATGVPGSLALSGWLAGWLADWLANNWLTGRPPGLISTTIPGRTARPDSSIHSLTHLSTCKCLATYGIRIPPLGQRN